MFTEEPEIKMEIMDDGRVNVTIITNYYKDGIKKGEDNWGCCLEPNLAYLEYASDFLDEYHLNIIRSVWTEGVVSKYEKNLEDRRIKYMGQRGEDSSFDL